MAASFRVGGGLAGADMADVDQGGEADGLVGVVGDGRADFMAGLPGVEGGLAIQAGADGGIDGLGAEGIAQLVDPAGDGWHGLAQGLFLVLHSGFFMGVCR